MNGYTFTDYYQLSIHYADTTGTAYYEDTIDYWIIDISGDYYLLCALSRHQADRAPEQLPDMETVYACEITEESYNELVDLFE